MNRILITGGAGFVGSCLALRFRVAFPAAEVICLDNLYRRGSELNRDRLIAGGATFVKGDVREAAAFDLPACDLVIDAAAEPSVTAGLDGDETYVVDTNLGGTLNMLRSARRWSAAVVFLSTSRVYPVSALRSIRVDEGATRLEIAAAQEQPGISAAGIAESFPLEGSKTLYGATKFASEVMVREYAAQFGVRAIVDRCGVLAGPWQLGRADQGIVAFWVAAHHYRMPLKYIGYGGKQVRDVLHIEDLADLLLAQVARSEEWQGEVLNVGGGRPVSVSLRELTELARAATGHTFDIAVEPDTRRGDVPLYITDTARVRNVYGWAPSRSVEQIVEDTASWIETHESCLRGIFV